MKHVLVTGGRGYGNTAFIEASLQQVREHLGDFVLVHGDANGADALADAWAQREMLPRCIYPAQWHVYGNSAGPRRNRQMLEMEPVHLVVAFKGGRGTAHMVDAANKAGIQVWDLRGEG